MVLSISHIKAFLGPSTPTASTRHLSTHLHMASVIDSKSDTMISNGGSDGPKKAKKNKKNTQEGALEVCVVCLASVQCTCKTC